jgi:arginine decarboxylase
VNLYVSSAVGCGKTELAAFDRALIDIGAANFNLIRLSSVIPPASSLVDVPRCPVLPGAGWGDRLYVVYAEQRTSRPGAEVWAGIGWVQDPRSGAGLLVEHEGDDESSVRGDIAASLEELQVSRGIDLGPPNVRVIGGRCTGQPCCALVLCVFSSEGWSCSPVVDRAMAPA